MAVPTCGRNDLTMDSFVFAKTRDYYFLLSDETDSTDRRAFSAASLATLNGAKQCGSQELSEAFGPEITFSESRYTIETGDDYLLLITRNKRLSLFGRRWLSVAATEAKQRVTDFKLVTRERLINKLYASKSSLSEYVDAWAEYFLFDHYSLWIYNKYTGVFTCSTASFEQTKNFISEQENSSLNAVLADDYVTESRATSNGLDVLNDMKTINRMKLSLGYDGTIGVLSFYSKLDHFELQDRHCEEIRNSLETKYLQVRQQAYQALQRVNQQFIEKYTAGELDRFLFSIACEVRESFQTEACSIFLADRQASKLELVASCDDQCEGGPPSSYVYSLAEESPTANVFNSKQMAFSYNLKADDPQNEGYNESTNHPPTNWIGAPLLSAGECFGVLRIRNKYVVEDGKREITYFRTADFVNLFSLCSNLANLIRIEILFDETEARLKETNANISEMSDFNKVFLHEIRTPISKFTMAPEIIKRTLSKKELTEENLEKVVKQLDDIQVMGDRLEFIAKTFNFNQIVTRRNFETLSVLRDIVYPVINITRAYLRKQYDIDIQLDAAGLQSCRVYGDKTLLNIVFNTLIDNAGKYSIDTRRPISISGQYHDSGDFFDIVVSNYGLAIHEDERETLFANGARGQDALKHGISGTGIGLHLAKRIMIESNGELLLTSLKDPVSFTLRVPAKPRGQVT